MEDFIDKLNVLSDSKLGETPSSIHRIAGGGGDRQYFRLSYKDNKTLIGVISDDLRDAEAFIKLSNLFEANKIPVPKVLAFSNDFKIYIQQDLGDVSLFSLIKKGDSEIESHVKKVMVQLAKMQCIPEKEWINCVAYKPFSLRQINWDLNYFKYEYLKPSSITFDEDLLEDDFDKLAQSLYEVPEFLWGFQMRDCQSRNIMMNSGPYFIDYQGGRKGPCLYDAVSFLLQAKACFTDSFRNEMFEFYASEFSKIRGTDKKEILKYRDQFILFRTLQVLGAYCFRGLVQKRAHFIESIPSALDNLSGLLRSGVLNDYNELKRICSILVDDKRFVSEEYKGLNIKVFSFSYKKGYPEDFSGNGGGFMFDCRGMHNPGRYDAYKSLTGRDKPVIEFLKERGEADRFAERAFEIVSPSVERYIQRGFSSLHIGFGCTGGQHRSVYCAEKVAHKIAEEFPDASVELIHREQYIQEAL